MTTSPEKQKAIRQIQLRAKLARRSFYEFVRFVGGITPADHQKQWIKALQEVADNWEKVKADPDLKAKRPELSQTLIIAPPGSGKTQILVLFTAWMIGRAPDQHFGYLSYADQVAWQRSDAVRAIVESSKPYRLTFPEVRMNPAHRNKASFRVFRTDLSDPHPTLRAGGTRSAVVAYRLNGLVIDDPHDLKNSVNRDQREKVWQNYQQSISTRLTADAWQVVITTRWAEKDFAGMLIAQQGWRVIHLRAMKKDGSSYWPKHYPASFLEKKRFDDPTLFSTQYQGNPRAKETSIIKHVVTYDEPPEELLKRHDLVLASGWDTAFKRRQENDFSVGYIGGLDKYGRIYILYRVKDRWGFPELMEQVNTTSVIEVPDRGEQRKFYLAHIWIEDQGSGQSISQAMMAEMPHLPVEAVKSVGDKHQRAHYLAPHIHGGQVLFPRYATWFTDAEYFLTAFPHEDFDDDLDALYILVSNLLQVRHPDYLYNRPKAQITVG